MDSLITRIKKQLTEKLPGYAAQIKLAPEGRDMFAEQTKKTNAAILILIFKNDQDRLSTIFMKRPTYNGHHSGQISFPGGKYESEDQTIKQTAIRETVEEIGISKEKIEIIGQLTDLYIPVSNFLVHPFVAIYTDTPLFSIDPSEVQYTISSPLSDLIELPIHHKQMSHEDRTFNSPYFSINNEVVWGATAMILNEFIEIIKLANKAP